MKISWSLNMWNKFWESKRVKMSYFWKMLFIWLPEGDDCGKVFSVLRDFEIHWRDHIHLGEKYYTWESWEQSIKIEILSSMSNISEIMCPSKHIQCSLPTHSPREYFESFPGQRRLLKMILRMYKKKIVRN